MAFSGNIGHLEGIESPWGNAGGVVKTLEDVERMAHTGVGWIEAGSYTLEPRKGNRWNNKTGAYEGVDYVHLPDGSTYNSLGMPNQGLDQLETEIPEMADIAHGHGKKLIINVAPVSEEPETEAVELIRRAYAAGADGVLLNAGCPNVKGKDNQPHQILSRSPEAFREVTLLVCAEIDEPIFVRLSPQPSDLAFQEIGKTILQSGVYSAVFTPNTWPVQPLDRDSRPLLTVNNGNGGASGPFMAIRARIQTMFATDYFEKSKKVDVVSSAGITSARELQKRLTLGAVAGAGTTFFYESESWQSDTDRLLSDLVDAD